MQVDQVLLKHSSRGSIVRLTDVAYNDCKGKSASIRTSAALVATKKAQRKRRETLELDGYGAGWPSSVRRGTVTFVRLWWALLNGTGGTRAILPTFGAPTGWKLPARASSIVKAGTRVVAALNSELRHRCGVPVRRSHSSKCCSSHYNCIRIVIDRHPSPITLTCLSPKKLRYP